MKQRSVFGKVVIPIFFAVIVLYLIFSAWDGLRDPYPTVVAYTDSLEESVPTNGWIIRTEQPLQGVSGMLQSKLQDGEKVGKGQTIAVIYPDQQYVEHEQDILQLKSALTELQYATAADTPTGTALEQQQLQAMANLKTAGSSGNFGDSQTMAQTYRKLVLRREFLISSDAAGEMAGAAAGLSEQLSSLQTNQSAATTVTAEATGVFSTHLDGYESLLITDGLADLLPGDLESFSTLSPKDEEGYLGKLILDGAWYYAATVPAEAADRFTVGETVTMHFDALSDDLNMKVYSKSAVQDDKIAVVFSATDSLKNTLALRQESGRVIFRSSTGIRVPKAALRVLEDGSVGVYVVSGFTAKFRPVTILAEGEDYYLLEPNLSSSEDKRILRTGDAVIIASADLYNGKVVR